MGRESAGEHPPYGRQLIGLRNGPGPRTIEPHPVGPRIWQWEFRVGYFDRVEGRVLIVPFQQVVFPEHDPQAFRLVDPEGRSYRVPFHRVREIYKDGQRIWYRPQDAK